MATEKQLIRYRIDDDTEILIEGLSEVGDGPQRRIANPPPPASRVAGRGSAVGSTPPWGNSGIGPGRQLAARRSFRWNAVSITRDGEYGSQ